MSIIPDFLLKRVYKKGSLRQTAEGIAFDLKNIFGSGNVIGINYIEINGKKYESKVINIITSGLTTIAEHVSPDKPIKVRFNQEGTLFLKGAEGLKEGLNKIIVEITGREFGKVQVSLSDNI